jgi:phosphoglycerol transferase MdoB-like AlkP superfamily enzyme
MITQSTLAMIKVLKIFKYFLYFSLFALLVACAPVNKNTYYSKKKKASQVNASQLGRNRYYFSPSYQKKLNKTFKKK